MFCKWRSTFLLTLNRHFLGLPFVRMMGMVKQMLVWSGEGGRERNQRWERGHVHDTKDEPSTSPANLCPSSKCHRVASHHLKPCSITYANWSGLPFITFPCVVLCIFLLRVPQNLDLLSCGPGFGGNLWC